MIETHLLTTACEAGRHLWNKGSSWLGIFPAIPACSLLPAICLRLQCSKTGFWKEPSYDHQAIGLWTKRNCLNDTPPCCPSVDCLFPLRLVTVLCEVTPFLLVLTSHLIDLRDRSRENSTNSEIAIFCLFFFGRSVTGIANPIRHSPFACMALSLWWGQ